MGLNAKNKGASGERQAAELLMSWARLAGHPLKIERNLEQVRYGGADLNGVPGMEIEVKRVEANALNSWWDQVCKASRKSGKWPLLMFRPNRKPWRFQTYVQAAVYTPGGQGVIVPVVAQMDEYNAKIWFQTWLKQQLGENDG